MLNSRFKSTVLALAVTAGLLSGTAAGAYAAVSGPGPSTPVVSTPETGDVPNAVAVTDFVRGMAGKKLVITDIHANDPTVFDASKDILIDPVTGAHSAPMVGKVTKLEYAEGTAKLIQVGPKATRFEYDPKGNGVKRYVASYFSSVDKDDEANPLRGATAQANIEVDYDTPALPILGGGVLPNATAGDDEAIGENGQPAGVGDILENDETTPDSVWIPNSTKVFGLTPEPVELKDRVNVISTPQGDVTLTVWENNSVSAELDSDGKAAEVEFHYAAIDSDDATGFAKVKLTVLAADTPEPELNEPPLDPNVPVITPAPELNDPPVAEPVVPGTPELNEPPVTEPVVPSEDSTPVAEEVPALVSEDKEPENNETTPVAPKASTVENDGDQIAITAGEAAEATPTNESGFNLTGYVVGVFLAIGSALVWFLGKPKSA